MKFKGIRICILVLLGFLICLTFSPISNASNVLKMIAVDFYTVNKIIIDDVEKTPPSDLAPFVYKGRTYVPLRYVAEALNKPVNWDAQTGTIYIGGTQNNFTDSNIKPPPFNQTNTNEIYDSLTGPLSNKWDLSKSGKWAVDSVNGVYPSSDNIYQPLFLDTTKYPNINNSNYTMEVKIAFRQSEKCNCFNGGVIINCSGDFNNEHYSNTVGFGHGVYNGLGITERGNVIVDYKFSLNKYYTIKVCVKSDNVDIYIDDSYITSVKIKSKGGMIGLYSTFPGNELFKDFKLTVNE